jgi:hypothetical protein
MLIFSNILIYKGGKTMDYTKEKNRDYTESFMTIKGKNRERFSLFIERVQLLGKDYYKQYGVEVLNIVTAKEHVKILGSQKVALKKNYKYLFFTGRKCLQSNRNFILCVNNHDVEKNHPCWQKLNLKAYPFRIKITPASVDKKVFEVEENEDGTFENKYLKIEDFKFPEKKRFKVVVKRKTVLTQKNQ